MPVYWNTRRTLLYYWDADATTQKTVLYLNHESLENQGVTVLSKDAANIQESLQRIGKISGVISVIFKVALIVVIAFAALFFGSALIGFLAPSLHLFDTVPSFGLSLIPDFLCAVSFAITLFIIMKVFKDISKGISPFTLNQTKRLRIIGWLLIVGIAIDIVVSMNASSVATVAGLDLGYMPSPQRGLNIFINGSYLVGAIVSFCLSYVFKYGALLQRLSDDTV